MYSGALDREYTENSVARTERWLERCKAEMTALNRQPGTINPQQLLFGINQGGLFPDVRIRNMETIAKLDLPGYALAGWQWVKRMRKCMRSWM